jgi:hypothetical protein
MDKLSIACSKGLIHLGVQTCKYYFGLGYFLGCDANRSKYKCIVGKLTLCGGGGEIGDMDMDMDMGL